MRFRLLCHEMTSESRRRRAMRGNTLASLSLKGSSVRERTLMLRRGQARLSKRPLIAAIVIV
jgi:hypothetical protein